MIATTINADFYAGLQVGFAAGGIVVGLAVIILFVSFRK